MNKNKKYMVIENEVKKCTIGQTVTMWDKMKI